MDYAGALQYLYSFVDWERGIGFGVGAPPRFTLDRIGALLRILGNPHLRFSSVHIAGSKGKGSTAAIIESILRTAGSRTGLYTQPHLHTFRERVRIDNVPVEPEVFARLVERVAVAVESLNAAQPNLGKPTTYELATALGFLCFAEADVDVAVVEVGLGGRLDATNVLTPLVSVVTSISLEHTAILGDTLAAVAREKAGIIKEGGVLVHAPNPAAVESVFQEVCAERRARLIAAEANRCELVADTMTDDSSAPVCSYVRPEPVAGPSVHGSTGSPRTDLGGDGPFGRDANGPFGRDGPFGPFGDGPFGRVRSPIYSWQRFAVSSLDSTCAGVQVRTWVKWRRCGFPCAAAINGLILVWYSP